MIRINFLREKKLSKENRRDVSMITSGTILLFVAIFIILFMVGIFVVRSFLMKRAEDDRTHVTAIYCLHDTIVQRSFATNR